MAQKSGFCRFVCKISTDWSYSCYHRWFRIAARNYNGLFNCVMNKSKGFHALVAEFQRQNWRFEADEPRLVLHSTFGLRHTRLRCVAVINPEDDLFQIVCILPVIVPAEKRVAVAELCVRAGWGLRHGRFELNLDDGELHFHASMPYANGDLSQELITRLIGTALFAADGFFPAFMRVLYGNCSPSQALSQGSESTSNSSSEPSEEMVETPSRIEFN